MTEAEARALFLEHCQPGDMSHYGEKAAVAAILAALEPLRSALCMASAALSTIADMDYEPRLTAVCRSVEQICDDAAGSDLAA